MNLFSVLKFKPRPRPRPALRSPSTPSMRSRASDEAASAAADRLSPLAQRWVKALPAAVRPLELSNRFPRIANRLALCWNYVDLVESVFNELLVDHRGGREGFPTQVANELLRLHAFHEARLPVDPRVDAR
jgi:hypothetical protein